MYRKIKISPTEDSTNTIKKIEDGATIPFEDGNRDYEEYKKWLAEGNTPEPSPPAIDEV